MASKSIPISQLQTTLLTAIQKGGDDVLVRTDKALRSTTIATLNEIMIKTPVDTGRARGNWFITQNTPSTKIDKAGKIETRQKEVSQAVSAGMLGKKFYFTNNLPYIKALEYGLYPKNPKKGSRNESGKFEIKTKNGFSKQAPKGMVRISIKKFSQRLRKALRATK